MLSDTLPVLVCVDLLALLDVPEEDDDGRNNGDYGTQPLVVPLHVMEEESDPLSGTWSIVTAVQKLLCKFVEQLQFGRFTLVKSPYLVVDARVVFE